MLDPDILLRGNLVAWIQENLDSSVLLMAGSDPWDQLNGGSIYAAPGSNLIIKSWLQLLNRSVYSEQAALGQLTKRRKHGRDVLKRIPLHVLGQCGEPASLATHYNCK